MKGIYEIEYKLPKRSNNGKIIPGKYRKISNPKTVYNPAEISNEKMYEWGQEAMKHGKINVENRIVDGKASNGLGFRGYLDENGEITNFYPVLKSPKK